MTESLRRQLRAMGWRSSNRYKGFLQTWREGIEFQIGRPGGGGLELRYFYRTARAEEEGTVSLPEGAPSAAVEEALTEVYRRVHERPLRRTLGSGGQRPRPDGGASSGQDATQLGLDFSANSPEN